MGGELEMDSSIRQAFTPILGYYVQKFPESPEEVFRTIPGSRNSGRYKPYNRLDLGASTMQKLERKCRLFLSNH